MWQTCDTHVSHVTDNIFCIAVWLTSFFHLPTVHTYLSIQFANGQDMYWRQLWVCGDCLSYPFRFKAVKDSFLVLTDTHFASKCISNCWSEWKACCYRSRNPAIVEGCCTYVWSAHNNGQWIENHYLILCRAKTREWRNTSCARTCNEVPALDSLFPGHVVWEWG